MIIKLCYGTRVRCAANAWLHTCQWLPYLDHLGGNGKRFMAYGLVELLKQMNCTDILQQLSLWVNDTDKKRNKQHEVFEPSFDKKECYTTDFILQKLDYIHLNPCRYKTVLADKPEDYVHSSAKYYLTGEQGLYTVTHYAALQDIDLTAPL